MWLWSCSPLGIEVKDAEPQPEEMAEFQQVLRPRDLLIFFGAIDHNKLSFPERMVVKAVRAPEGDFRFDPGENASEVMLPLLGSHASGTGKEYHHHWCFPFSGGYHL